MDETKEWLISEFNQQSALLVISSYPEKGSKYSGLVCAVAGFTKNTLDSLSSYFAKNGRRRKIVVLTVIINEEELYQENGFLVWRVFRRNHPLSYLRLWRAIGQFNQIKKVLIEFEFASFGDTRTTLLLPLILFILRWGGKDITLVLHQVVSDLKELTGHLGWKRKEWKIKLFNFGLRLFFWGLVFPSKTVVTLEKVLKERLVRMVGMREKVVVIPHGVDQGLAAASRNEARMRLGLKKNEPVVLFFGYLTWYKGVDFLLKTFAENKIKVKNKQVRLVVAGGESATQKTKRHYQKFVKRVYGLTKKLRRVTITGFIEEKNLPLYFAAADLVVLPYRTLMSSSGPLSLCLSFSKPFIISKALRQYFSSRDFATAFAKSGLEKEAILFSLQSRSLATKIESAFENRAKLASFSMELAKKRDFNVLAASYAKFISGHV